MSALKVLDLAQQQGLLDEQAADQLRSQVAMSASPVSAEAVAEALVRQGHLTQFQASRLLSKLQLGAPGEDLLESPGGIDLALDDDDDVVLLEAVEPSSPVTEPAAPPPASGMTAPRDRSPSSPVKKTSSEPPPPPKQPAVAKPPKPPGVPPGVTAPMDLADPSTDLQPVAQLRPVAPLRPIGGMKPLEVLQPLGELQPVEGLTPLGGLEPVSRLEPLGPSSQLTPIGGDDLLSDPLIGASGLTAVDPLTGRSATPPPPTLQPRAKRNQWDSPLLLVGGGLLGAIAVVFALLYFSLTRGSAAEMFAQAEAEYNQGAYPSAIVGYDTFLKRYPDDPKASLARVRRGLAQIRSLGDGGKDPAASLQRVSEVLPQIENEPGFSEARVELAQILPTIADSFAQQAQDAQESEQREQLVQSTEEAMKFVTNPTYIPSSLRKDIEGRISSILDKLKLARRDIDQEQELQKALAKIESAASAGNAAEGYAIRKSLLKSFPALSANARLSAAVLSIAERERELVQVTRLEIPASTEDVQPDGYRVVLADRSGEAGAVASGQRLFPLLEGAVYACNADTGRVSWRRYVGLETSVQPVPLSALPDADVLVVDGRSTSLLRLQGATGKLVWRQELGERCFAPQLLDENTAIVSTAAGRLLSVRLNDGTLQLQAQLPQRLTVGPCLDAKRKVAYQLGEHSTVFVFDLETLECEETYYLGHTPGAILAPPAVVLDHLLIPESPSDDYSLLHILKPKAEGGGLAEPAQPFRMKGRITTPLSTSGRRTVAVSDLGEISVLEIDSASEKQSVRELAKIAATDASRVNYFHLIEGSRLWVAGRRCSLYEIQGSLQKLNRVWSLHQDEAFVGPLRLINSSLVHFRRRPKNPGILVEACEAATGNSQWQSSLTSPIVAVAASEPRAQLTAITAAGDVFEVDRETLSAGYMDQPTASPPEATPPWNLRDAVEIGPGRLVCSNFPDAPQALVYDVTATENRVRWLKLPAAVVEATAPPALFHGGLLVPLRTGRVLLLSSETGNEQVLPFQPALEAGITLRWTKPVALPPDGSTAAVSDGLSRLFRVTVQDDPKPHLSAIAQAPLGGAMESPLAATSDAVYGVVRSGSGDQLTAFQLSNLAPVAGWPMTGGCAWGPVAVGGQVYATDDTALYCVGAGPQLLWKYELLDGPIASAPLVRGDEIVVVHRSGVVKMLSSESGNVLATIDVGEPAGGGAALVGQRLLIGGADGTLHLVTLPKPQ